jgi:peptidoglycan/LPS O-acetylase OafA/YrhL
LAVEEPSAAQTSTVVQAGERRSSTIESLRALAAISVMLAHTLGTARTKDVAGLLQSRSERVVYAGGYGVFLFFALSGFLLFWPFVDSQWGRGRTLDLRAYALNRVLRILPLYWIVMATVLIVQEHGSTVRHWLIFASFSENFFGDTVAQINPVVWSVVIEAQFYVFLPLIAWLLIRLARGKLSTAAAILLLTGLLSFAIRYAFYLGSSRPDVRLGQYSLPATFGFFVSGMSLALLRVRWRSDPPRWLTGALGASDSWVACSAVLWLVVLVAYGGAASWNWTQLLCAPASALLVGACVLPLRPGRVVRLLSSKALAAVGIASYSIYLWHVPIESWMYRRHYAFVHHFGEMALIAIPICLAVGFLSYRLIEAPFLSLRKRWGPAV